MQVIDELYIYDLNGKRIKRIAEDFVGAISVSNYRDQEWFFATLSGFTTPGTVAKYDFRLPEDERWSVYRNTLVKGLKPEDFSAEQVSASGLSHAKTLRGVAGLVREQGRHEGSHVHRPPQVDTDRRHSARRPVR